MPPAKAQSLAPPDILFGDNQRILRRPGRRLANIVTTSINDDFAVALLHRITLPNGGTWFLARSEPKWNRQRGVGRQTVFSLKDASGCPVRLFTTTGQVTEYPEAAALMSSLSEAEWLLAV